ncbi:hypothetical protein QFZ82_000405 [Streptomyces sp. V4I23]|nr:hypothetical protein [Streptomyces sp. V4I23]
MIRLRTEAVGSSLPDCGGDRDVDCEDMPDTCFQGGLREADGAVTVL